MSTNRIKTKLSWPHHSGMRRHRIDMDFHPADFKNQLRAFERWIVSELKGCRPYLVQEEKLEFRVPVPGTSETKESPRWFVEIEVDEFPIEVIEPKEPKRWRRVVNAVMGVKPPEPEVITYPRVQRFYSLSPRQHTALKEWLNPGLDKF